MMEMPFEEQQGYLPCVWPGWHKETHPWCAQRRWNIPV